MSNNSVRFMLVTMLLAFILLALPARLAALDKARHEPKIPDIPGYTTLKCDFHIHTVFSDGYVWPTVRADEAWREGLDAFAITDHIEYLPHKEYFRADHNSAHEVTVPAAAALDIMLIKGSEITKAVPPGHFNAIFLTNSNLVEYEGYMEAIGAAKEQGAFVFWNHPKFRQKGGREIWHPEHTLIYEAGLLDGIEVVNGNRYYPKAHRWCIEKNLALLSTSDIHQPINLVYDPVRGDRRPMNLVFVTEKSVAGIKEALFARRTVVYAMDRLYGDAGYLKPIFEASIKIKNKEISLVDGRSVNVQIKNTSDIPYQLSADGEVAGIKFPKEIKLLADATVLLRISADDNKLSGKQAIKLPYQVTNLRPTPEEGLRITLDLVVNFSEE